MGMAAGAGFGNRPSLRIWVAKETVFRGGQLSKLSCGKIDHNFDLYSIGVSVQNQIEELTQVEIDEVNGAGFWEAVGYALGFAAGSGAKMKEYIDSMDNTMLSGMSMGA